MLGVAAAMAFGSRADRNGAYVSSFAVGLLSVAVIFHLLPEAFGRSQGAFSWVAYGFLAMVLTGIAVQAAVSRSAHGAALTFGYASIIALSAHSLLDGAIYAAAFQDEAITGWFATGGLLFHEFPEGVIAYSLLYAAGLSRIRSMILAIIAASLTTIAGTFGAYFILDMTGGLPLSAMYAGAAGGLIYVLIVHLGPHAAQTPAKNGYGYIFAALGVAIATVAVILNSFGGH